MKVEVIERHTFVISDRELAADVRQALDAGDIERLDELVSHLNSDGGPMTERLSALRPTPIPRSSGAHGAHRRRVRATLIKGNRHD